MKTGKKSKNIAGEKERKSGRVEGDLLTYFIAHNIISVFFFFVFTVYFGIYIGKERLISFVFQKEFWEMTIFQVFPIGIVSSIIGRITAYYIMKLYYDRKNRRRKMKKSMKRWNELNSGINRLGLAFFLAMLITSIIFSLGLIGILQFMIFNEKTLLTLIAIYIGVKIATFYLVSWFVGTKL